MKAEVPNLIIRRSHIHFIDIQGEPHQHFYNTGLIEKEIS